MATTTTAEIRWFANEWDFNMDYPSAVLSGIVGDRAHLAGGGYHLSIQDNRAGNYSVVRPDDAAPPGGWRRDVATGIDMSMSTADMIKCWYRVERVWLDRGWDTRARYFNAVNGWNGVGKAERLDFVSGARSITDDTHKWHTHDETRRRYSTDMVAMRAKASVYRGETHAQYLASIGQGSTGVASATGGADSGMIIYFKTSSRQGTPVWALAGTGTGPSNWVEARGGKYETVANGWAANTISKSSIELTDEQWDDLKAQHTAVAPAVPAAPTGA